jgi:hypothetical protein
VRSAKRNPHRNSNPAGTTASAYFLLQKQEKAATMRVVLILILLALLAAVGVFAYQGLTLPGEAMPSQGYAAMAIGIVLSLAVGVGLMALLFFSSRRGYDEPPKLRSPEDGPPQG